MNLFFSYLKHRVNFFQLFGLAFLLVLLTLSPQSSNDLGEQITFVFLSLLVFRLLDDLGSVHYDRIHHPHRTYLLPSNFKSMMLVLSLVLITYLGSCFYFDLQLGIILSGFIGVSVLMYSLFGETKFLAVIPLLKYPVLLWCASYFPTNLSTLLLLLSSAFLLGAFDVLELVRNKPSVFSAGIVLLIVYGVLVFQPWENWFYSGFIIMPLVLAYLCKSKTVLKYIPLVYFPFVHFLTIVLL